MTHEPKLTPEIIDSIISTKKTIMAHYTAAKEDLKQVRLLASKSFTGLSVKTHNKRLAVKISSANHQTLMLDPPPLSHEEELDVIIRNDLIADLKLNDYVPSLILSKILPLGFCVSKPSLVKLSKQLVSDKHFPAAAIASVSHLFDRPGPNNLPSAVFAEMILNPGVYSSGPPRQKAVMVFLRWLEYMILKFCKHTFPGKARKPEIIEAIKIATKPQTTPPPQFPWVISIPELTITIPHLAPTTIKIHDASAIDQINRYFKSNHEIYMRYMDRL